MGAHNAVTAVMPEIGNNSVATVATQLLNDFTSIRFGLLVGIGGGIPGDDEDDIRLGDVVVSKPTAIFGGGCVV
jgi:nucleoside phosphorylase